MQYLLNTKLQSIGQKIINKYLSGEQISNIDSLEIISKYLEKSLAISDEFDSYYNRILAMQIFAQAVYISKDSVEKSIELLERALIIFPDASYICNELGHLYAIKENYIEATNKFSIALYYTPNWKIPNYNLGILYAKWDNQFDKSLVYLNRAIKIDPNYTNALHARGKIYFATGKYKNALKDLKKVIKLEPELKDELDVFIDESTKKLESKK
jgi:tetratricopeptide (TPR) repeat protein